MILGRAVRTEGAGKAISPPPYFAGIVAKPSPSKSLSYQEYF